MRNWIHVLDHCAAINLIVNDNNAAGEIFNIGSKTLITNLDLIKNILKSLNKSEELISFVTDRPAHDLCYHLCSDKIMKKYNWKETKDFSEEIQKLANWNL
jgi:dTDP-glucose 4,6-dehydratase